MPPPKKALSPASRAKADKRNARLQEKITANVAASGGAKSGKKQRKMTDLTEEEMPVSCGGSSSSAPEFCRDLLLDIWKSKELWIAEEKARFYERCLGLQDSYVNFLQWNDARQVKKIEALETDNEVLKKKYQDVLDLNSKEYEEAQQEVTENLDAHLTCLDHYLDLWHLCCGKIMDTQEPINHTKLLRKWGYKFKHFL
jgi:hypothetical protein